MTRRKCMANIIAVVMVMLISMASLIEELKGAGDKVEIFRIALIPGLWLLVIIFWVAKYLKAPRDTTMYKGKSLASIVGCIIAKVMLEVSSICAGRYAAKVTGNRKSTGKII